MKKVFIFSYFFFFTSLLCSVTAFAYIDPSAMTYMVQLIAGIAIAAGAGAGFYLRKLKRRFFRHDKSRDRAVSQSCGWDDDDDTGYGDYELDEVSQANAASFSASGAAEAPARKPVYVSAAEPITAAVDPFDEAGGEGGLAAENRELRRLLAEERRKVEDLKRALYICTAPRR